jgi:hypothetical protein
MPFDDGAFQAPTPAARLTARLAVIDAVLSSAPRRIRELPVRRTLWRFLLLDIAKLSLLLSLLPKPAKGAEADPSIGLREEATSSLQSSLTALDMIVLRLVGKALLGDVRAMSCIFDVIEGRTERRRRDASRSRYVQGRRDIKGSVDPSERARMIAELEAVLQRVSRA